VAQGQIRIIGGQWRGSKITVADLPDLRPTPDRVRETLFNWLAPVIVGAHCADLFSGSGALGFESLSRGAAHVVMIDQSLAVVNLLQKQLTLLGVKNADIYCEKIPQGLKKPKQLFDIVFLDPPFQQDILLSCCFYLEEHGFLADSAYIYLESKTMIEQQQLPSNWQLLKVKKAGQVAYHLALRKEAV